MRQSKPRPRTLQGGGLLLASLALGACGNWFGGPSVEVPTATAFPEADAPLPVRSQAPNAGASAAPGAVGTPGATAAPQLPPSPRPSYDPYREDPSLTQGAKTPFKPQLSWTLDDQKPGATPKVSISIYQTKGELEVKEARFLLENTQFRFDQLKLKQQVGGGSLDVGTPPKLSLPIAVTTEEIDLSVPTAVFSVIAQGPGAKAHVADLKIRPTSEGLSIISLGNMSRANDHRGVRTTEYSARVTQSIDSGWFVLPVQPVVRSRVNFVSDTDPDTGEVALLSQWPSFRLMP